MKEIWKDIPEYPNYEISNTAKVRRKERKIKHSRVSCKELSSRLNKFGYVVVRLTINGKRKWKLVHRLLAETFIDNPDNKPQINHIDGDKTNNNLDNLEWVTAKENTRHAWHTGLCTAYDRYGEKNHMYGKTISEKHKEKIKQHNIKSVYMIDIDTDEIIKEFRSLNDAADYVDCHSSNITQACRGQQQTAGGYKWKYKDK